MVSDLPTEMTHMVISKPKENGLIREINQSPKHLLLLNIKVLEDCLYWLNIREVPALNQDRIYEGRH